MKERYDAREEAGYAQVVCTGYDLIVGRRGLREGTECTAVVSTRTKWGLTIRNWLRILSLVGWIRLLYDTKRSCLCDDVLRDDGGKRAGSRDVTRIKVSRRAVVAGLSDYSLRLCGAHIIQPAWLIVERQLALHYRKT